MLIYLYIYDASATDISTLSLHDALPISRVAPDVLQQRLAAVDVPRLGRERGEDLELDVGELDRLAAHRHRAALEVDAQIARVDGLFGRRSGTHHLGTAQRRLDAAAELAHRERLGDVVVGADLEAEDLVDLVVLGREHDDRDLAAGPQPAADLDPVELWKHD